MSDFPATLATARMTLRRPRLSDSGPMRLYAGDARVANLLENVPHPYPSGAAEAFIERCLSGRSAEHVWVMDASHSDGAEFIGVIGLKRLADAPCRLGYWVGPPFWNTGYASEAAQAIVDMAAANGVEQIDARIAAQNEASAHVLTNTGFREAGGGDFFSVALGEVTPHRLFEWRAPLAAPTHSA